ncbi:MAG TPA: hypothetical protein DEG23_02405 [Coxiellaceae bacterium]|nr:hypothetical protein [Coxiellaceae bacterium]
MFTLDKKSNYWLWYLILSLFAFFSFYFAIGSYPLFDNNEGLYASIAKYMFLNKSFIIPHLNCVPYIEKPPFLYWLLSLSFSAFGLTAFAARFVTTTSAVLLCIVIIYFSKKIKQAQIGFIGALIFASSIGVSIIARMVYFDMLFTLLISSSLFCLFYWYESQKISILRIGYLFLGLAVLTKGLVAVVLICGSFGLFLILEGNFRRYLCKALDPRAIVIFLAIVLPWHLAAAIQHKGFMWHYIVEEHFLRFLNQREPHDYYQGPIYYYLPRIMIYLFPWSLFMPLIFWRTKDLNVSEQKLLRFSWCWLLFPLIFFSLSSAKANYYMIVSMPALAMILGVKIKSLVAKHPKIFNIWVTINLFLVSLVFSLVVFTNIIQINGLDKSFVIITIIYSLFSAIVVIAFVRNSQVVAVLLAGLIIPVMLTMVSYIKTTKDDLSAVAVGVYLTSEAKSNPLYIYQDFENISALSFYAPNCFKIIDSQSGDLYYGAHLPQFKDRFVNKEEFLQETSDKQAYIVIPTKKLPQFYHNLDPGKFSLVKRFNNLALLSNQR